MVFVLSIGIDGGNWEIIERGMREGFLPNIERIVREGCRGTLASYPPITYPQWYVLLSGWNPGNIGVYGFVTVDKERKKAWITTHDDFKAENLADYLSREGKRFAIINAPGVIPRSSGYTGYIVGDPFLPSPKYYPGSLRGVLSLIKYRNYDARISKSTIYSVPAETVVKLAGSLIEARVRLSSYIIKRDEKLRLLHVTIFVNDNVQHFFGLSHDVTKEVWRRIDSAVGRLVSLVESKYGNDYLVALVSDHGFTDIDTIYNIYVDLARKRLVKTSSGSIVASLLGRLGVTRDRAARIVEKPVVGRLARIALRSRRLTNYALRALPERSGENADMVFTIDMAGSKVVYANLGFYVLRGGDRAVEEIIDVFKGVRTPDGRPVFGALWPREKLIKGRYLDTAPDILATPGPGVHVSTRSSRDRFRKPVRGQDWLADHTPDAIIALWGPRLARRCSIRGSTMDYAPTLLHLVGVTDAAGKYGLDGAVIKPVIDSLAL